MISYKFIQDKLTLIDKYRGELDIIIDVPINQLRRDFIRYYATERVFQLIVDEMTDINTHIISYSDFLTRTPDDFESTFITLGENEILPENFAKRLAPVVGLRNRLVHRYEEIDKDLFLKMVNQEKDDFKKYIKYVKEYLNKKQK